MDEESAIAKLREFTDARGWCDLEKSLLNASHTDYSLYAQVRHLCECCTHLDECCAHLDVWCALPGECCAHLCVDTCGWYDLEKSLLNALHTDFSLYAQVQHVLCTSV